MPDRKTITFISRRAPYGSHNPQLCLDMALASAVFEQQVNYVFLDDGVHQLRKNQNGDVLYSKTLGNALETLDLYGIDNVLVDTESLQDRGLEESDLIMPVKLIRRADLVRLLKQSDSVFNL